METHKERNIRRATLNVILALGIAFISLGAVLLVFFASKDRAFFLRPIFFLIGGSFILYVSLTKTHKAKHVFLGSLLFLTAILFLCVDSNIIPLGFSELWPCIVINTAVSLIPAGLYYYKKLHPMYFVPAIVIALMGIIFLLFSLNIIKQPFSTVFATWWPILFVLSGIFLIILYFTNHKKNFDKEEEDTECM